MGYLVVFFGAGVGGALRHGVNLASLKLFGVEAFPFGTLFINVFGSLLIGVAAGFFALRAGAAAQHWRLFLATGVLGGFTTFSTFSLETVVLYQRGRIIAAVAYVAGSVVAGIAGLLFGLFLVRQLAAGPA